MSYEANLLNSVLDQIKAQCSGFVVPVDPLRVFLALVPASNQQYPAICIRFPQQPYDQGQWAATSNKKNSNFVLEIGVVCQLPSDGSHPYGDSTTPGILQLVTALENLIENGLATFQAASSEMVDYQFTTALLQNELANPPMVSATITIIFSTRYTAGNRGN